MGTKPTIVSASNTILTLSFVYAALAPLLYGTTIKAVLYDVYASHTDDWIYWTGILALLIPGLMIKFNIKRAVGYGLMKLALFVIIVVPVIYILNWRR